MKRGNIARLTLCLLATGMVGLLFWAASKHGSKVEGIRQLPEIRALTIYGDSFDVSEFLDSSKRTALMFFHPECEYCQIELGGIMEHWQECRNVQWLFLTLAPEDEAQAFLQIFPLDSIPYAYVLRENWPDTYRLYQVKGPPALFIYDENGKLIKTLPLKKKKALLF